LARLDVATLRLRIRRAESFGGKRLPDFRLPKERCAVRIPPSPRTRPDSLWNSGWNALHASCFAGGRSRSAMLRGPGQVASGDGSAKRHSVALQVERILWTSDARLFNQLDQPGARAVQWQGAPLHDLLDQRVAQATSPGSNEERTDRSAIKQVRFSHARVESGAFSNKPIWAEQRTRMQIPAETRSTGYKRSDRSLVGGGTRAVL